MFRVSKDEKLPKLSFYCYNLLVVEQKKDIKKYNQIKYNDMNSTLISMMKSLDKGNDVFLKICCLLWSKRSFVK